MLPCLKVSRKQIFQILVCRSRYFLFSFKITRFINIKPFISFKFRPPWRDNNTFVRWHFTVSDTLRLLNFRRSTRGKKIRDIFTKNPVFFVVSFRFSCFVIVLILSVVFRDWVNILPFIIGIYYRVFRD
uniref:Transmembrane protein n=1 Tax=Cacopsylla melanoneura TaxID=428564 RepID=A0A8D9AC75_9HEMI